MKQKQKILLTGTCRYELFGLGALLLGQGHEVDYMPSGNSFPPDIFDLVIVALSAEPVAGWGRHISWIKELKTRTSAELLVLVPEMLKNLKVLRFAGPVYSGCKSLQNLRHTLCFESAVKTNQPDRFFLTNGQRRAMKYISKSDRVRPLNLKQKERKLYYHYNSLAEKVGVRNFKLLLLTGLYRDIDSFEQKNI